MDKKIKTDRRANFLLTIFCYITNISSLKIGSELDFAKNIFNIIEFKYIPKVLMYQIIFIDFSHSLGMILIILKQCFYKKRVKQKLDPNLKKPNENNLHKNDF